MGPSHTASPALPAHRQRIALLVVTFGLLFPLAGISLFAFAARSDAADGVSAAATDLVPTRFDDPAPDGCQPDDCSLREAVIDSEDETKTPGHDRILLSRGVYTLTRPGADNTSQNGDLDFQRSVEISGAGAGLTIIDGGGHDRVIDIDTGAPVFLGSLSIRGGNAQAGFFGHAHGGGIHNHGQLSLSRVSISGNRSSGTPWGGGGLTNAGGTSTAVLRNVTIALNVTDYFGGGIENGGGLKLFNVTVSSNFVAFSPAGRGAGLANAVGFFPGLGTARLNNTIVAGNGQAGSTTGDCVGPVTSVGHNLASDLTCGLTGTGDAQGVDTKLSPISDESGFPILFELLAGSPGIDTGSGPYNATTDIGCLSDDQRGLSRPRDGDGNGTAVCDKGAFEVLGADLSLAKTDSPDPVAVGGMLTYTLTVTNHGADQANNVMVVDPLPAGVTFVSTSTPGSDSQNFCFEFQGEVSCFWGKIPAGESRVGTIVVRPDAIGTVTNTATVSATTVDFDPSDNAAIAITTVRQGCFGRLPTITESGLIFGTSGPDVIFGSNGRDFILAGGGNDFVCAMAGADLVGAGTGADRIDGGPDADILQGDGGNDIIFGGFGSDVLFGGFGMDNLDGDAPTGIDPSLHFDACAGGPDVDTAARCEAVFGVP